MSSVVCESSKSIKFLVQICEFLERTIFNSDNFQGRLTRSSRGRLKFQLAKIEREILLSLYQTRRIHLVNYNTPSERTLRMMIKRLFASLRTSVKQEILGVMAGRPSGKPICYSVQNFRSL